MSYTGKQKKFFNIAYVIISLVLTGFTSGLVLVPFMMWIENRIRFLSAIAVLSIIIFVLIFMFLTRKFRRRRRTVSGPFPPDWEEYLNRRVSYYNALEQPDRERFKDEIMAFLAEKTITGIGMDVDDETRVLVAASAIIPVFSFPGWEYETLGEILVYPDNFNSSDFNFNKGKKNVLGLVESGIGTMILSRPALFRGFENAADGHNVGIHEFAHKLDGEDGNIDGTPGLIMDEATAERWHGIVEDGMEKIRIGKSGLNPYALTNKAEFFAVASEEFFENPSGLERDHPEAFTVLKEVFRQDTKSLLRSAMRSAIYPRGKKIGRNSLCPCGSGKKYKKCCLNKT